MIFLFGGLYGKWLNLFDEDILIFILMLALIEIMLEIALLGSIILKVC